MKKYYLLLVFISFFYFSCAQVHKDSYVLLISFDGFRADYLDRYNTPNFDIFIKNGVGSIGMKPSFVTKTFPNHYSIATGMYVENHGLVGNHFYDPVLNENYTMSDRSKVEDPDYYGGEPIWVTAEKQGVKTASYFWVGSEAPIKGVYPSRWKRYDHDFPFESRIDSVVGWFSLPVSERPKLCLLYFHEPDGTGHDFGPESPETGQMVTQMDSVFGIIVEKMSKLDIYHQLNIIVVSDHGMAEISSDRTVNLSDYANMGAVIQEGSGPYAMLYSEAKGEIEKAVTALKNAQHISVFLKNEIPDRFHFKNHYRIKDALVLADEGWYISNQAISSSDTVGAYVPAGGTHGYDNNLMSMHTLFAAAGPNFQKGIIIEPFENIHIYPMIAHILNIEPNPEIDGKIDNIRTLLK
tara:strand:+ start:316 stop:1542 length:1227 start_codon:yes stop_codon:yes gene_type:complete